MKCIFWHGISSFSYISITELMYWTLCIIGVQTINFWGCSTDRISKLMDYVITWPAIIAFPILNFHLWNIISTANFKFIYWFSLYTDFWIAGFPTSHSVISSAYKLLDSRFLISHSFTDQVRIWTFGEQLCFAIISNILIPAQWKKVQP